MKKLLLLLLTILPIITHAQEGSGYGIKLGASFSNLNFKHEKFSKSGNTKLGPTIGIVAYAILSEKFRLYTDFSYSQINSEYTDTVTVMANTDFWFATPPVTSNFTDQIKIHQAEWFIMPEYRITDHFFVMAGATVSLVMARTIKDKKGYYDQEPPTAAGKILIESDDRVINAGLVAGVGYSIRNFRFDVRYIKGLTNLLDKESEEQQRSPFKSATYTSIQLSGAYIFGRPK